MFSHCGYEGWAGTQILRTSRTVHLVCLKLVRENNLKVLWISVASLGFSPKDHCGTSGWWAWGGGKSFSWAPWPLWPACIPVESGGNGFHCSPVFVTAEARCPFRGVQRQMESVHVAKLDFSKNRRNSRFLLGFKALRKYKWCAINCIYLIVKLRKLWYSYKLLKPLLRSW